MRAFALKNDPVDKKIMTFLLSKKTRDDLKKTLIESKKYNLRKKSDWVNEAIKMLKEAGDYKEVVYNSEVNENFDHVMDKIYMTFEQRRIFAEVRNEVVKTYPDIKGPQGAIIRAAIVTRLMRKQ